ncbi:MAG: hypothetical protein LBJ00_13530 [Planctomycetaceae bacterium]|nr:hypothetical protein [Planctomycetaceae bacterium]
MKFPKLNTETQQREAVVQGRSLSPYRLRYKITIDFLDSQKPSLTPPLDGLGVVLFILEPS